jgi:hypothetical protein
MQDVNALHLQDYQSIQLCSATTLNWSRTWTHQTLAALSYALCLMYSHKLHACLAFNFCQLHFELLFCGFYQCLCCLYVDVCSLDPQIEFCTEAVSLVIDRWSHCLYVLSVVSSWWRLWVHWLTNARTPSTCLLMVSCSLDQILFYYGIHFLASPYCGLYGGWQTFQVCHG